MHFSHYKAHFLSPLLYAPHVRFVFSYDLILWQNKKVLCALFSCHPFSQIVVSIGFNYKREKEKYQHIVVAFLPPSNFLCFCSSTLCPPTSLFLFAGSPSLPCQQLSPSPRLSSRWRSCRSAARSTRRRAAASMGTTRARQWAGWPGWVTTLTPLWSRTFWPAASARPPSPWRTSCSSSSTRESDATGHPAWLWAGGWTSPPRPPLAWPSPRHLHWAPCAAGGPWKLASRPRWQTMTMTGSHRPGGIAPNRSLFQVIRPAPTPTNIHHLCLDLTTVAPLLKLREKVAACWGSGCQIVFLEDVTLP